MSLAAALVKIKANKWGADKLAYFYANTSLPLSPLKLNPGMQQSKAVIEKK